MPNRKYQQVLGRNISIGSALFILFLLIIGFTAHAIVIVSAIVAIGLLSVTPVLIRMLQKGILQEYNDKLVCLPPVGVSHVFFWKDIISFETKGSEIKHKQVYVRLRDSDKPHILQGIGTKRLFTWDGGSTTNMVEELNNRLEFYRNK